MNQMIYHGLYTVRIQRTVQVLGHDLRKKIDMRFGTWKARSLYRAGSLETRYKLDLVGSRGQMGQGWH